MLFTTCAPKYNDADKNPTKRMKIKHIVALVFVPLFLTACDDIKAKLHLLPNQDEQECLNSERFNFKDPDVLFVANLGSRGLEVKQDRYWVRYKAKNSYGAYVQGNMACKKDASTGKWVKDEAEAAWVELTVRNALLAQAADRMHRDNEQYRAGKISLSDFKYRNEAAVYKSVDDDLHHIVYVSAESIARYAEKK